MTSDLRWPQLSSRAGKPNRGKSRSVDKKKVSWTIGPSEISNIWETQGPYLPDGIQLELPERSRPVGRVVGTGKENFPWERWYSMILLRKPSPAL